MAASTTNNSAASLTLLAASSVAAIVLLSLSRSRTRKHSYRTIYLSPHQKHYEGVLELARHTYGGHDWIGAEFFNWFKPENNCVALGLEHVQSGELAGLFVLRVTKQDAVGCLEALRVHPHHRGRGLAHRLQREMISEAIRRRDELGVRVLRYTVYDQNVPSVKVAVNSGMRVKHAFPYLMAAEDEGDAENEFLGRTGKGAIRTLLNDCKRAREPFGAIHVEEATSPQKIFDSLSRNGAELLYQDWKPFAFSIANLNELLAEKHHQAVVSSNGISLGVIKPDNEHGEICIMTHYSKEKSSEEAARGFLSHLVYWLEQCCAEGRTVSSIYCSYPEPAHEVLLKTGIVVREKPQYEYVLDLDIEEALGNATNGGLHSQEERPQYVYIMDLKI